MSPVTMEPNGAMHCDELDQQLVIVLVVQSKAWEPCAPISGNGDVWWRGVEGKRGVRGHTKLQHPWILEACVEQGWPWWAIAHEPRTSSANSVGLKATKAIIEPPSVDNSVHQWV